MGDIGVNILSDLIFTIAVIFFSWIYYKKSSRNRLLKFFGIAEDKRITIYTSNLKVKRYGATGRCGVRYSFKGIAIPYEESKASSQLKSLFNYFIPSPVEPPGFLSKLLVSDIDVQVLASPKEENVVEPSASFISLGLPPYNTISEYIEDSYNPSAKLKLVSGIVYKNISNYGNESNDNKRIAESKIAAGSAIPYDNTITSASAVPNSQKGKKQSFKPVISIGDTPMYSDTSIGFVQRVVDSNNKRNIFYIAGLSENSTAGSAYFLIANWKKLFSKYGSDTPFLILLRIGNNNHLSEIIFEKQSD